MTETKPFPRNYGEQFPRGSGDAAALRTRARGLTSPLLGTGSEPRSLPTSPYTPPPVPWAFLIVSVRATLV